MLHHRFIFGALMSAGLLAVLFFDDRLDGVDMSWTPFQQPGQPALRLPPGLLVLLATTALAVLACRELVRIFRAKSIHTDWFMLSISAVCGCMLMYITPQDMVARNTLGWIASVMIAIFMLSLYKFAWVRRQPEGAVAAAAASLFAFIYVGLMPGFYIAIRRDHSAWVIAAVVIITKACDIGAYFSGRWFGKHQLIPWLSPKKTWEGLVGGVVLSALVAAALAAINEATKFAGVYTHTADAVHFEPHYFDALRCAGAGVILGLVGQLGDLTASVFKRDAGVKDSGQSIPGFGGLIDILDSPLLAAPAAYWLLTL